MKIMIVDDEKLLRNGFKNMTDWSAKGINIIGEALNGEDALEKLKTRSPDIVITDIKMPIMDGVTLTKKIKELYPHILILVLSSHDDYDYVRESMKNGASDYLLKASIDIDDLCDTLKRITQDSQKPSLYNSKNINIDYYPTNFIVRNVDNKLFYIDYECNIYDEKWNYENWGSKYWKKTEEFKKAFESEVKNGKN